MSFSLNVACVAYRGTIKRCSRDFVNTRIKVLNVFKYQGSNLTPRRYYFSSDSFYVTHDWLVAVTCDAFGGHFDDNASARGCAVNEFSMQNIWKSLVAFKPVSLYSLDSQAKRFRPSRLSSPLEWLIVGTLCSRRLTECKSNHVRFY